MGFLNTFDASLISISGISCHMTSWNWSPMLCQRYDRPQLPFRDDRLSVLLLYLTNVIDSQQYAQRSAELGPIHSFS
jgi:hypothetical protein